jgi:hypothetical protein
LFSVLSKTETLDLSHEFVDPFLLLLLEPLQSKEEFLRKEAMTVASELVACVRRHSKVSSSSQPPPTSISTIARNALTLLWATLTNTSTLSLESIGSGSTKQQTLKFLPYWYQRVGLVHVVKELNEVAAVDTTLCNTVTEWLVTLLRIETTKEVLTVALDALISFTLHLPTLPSSVCSYLTQLFQTSATATTTTNITSSSNLSEDDELRRHSLSLLAHLLHSRPSFTSTLIQNAPQLIKFLIDRVLQCKTKPLFICEGILAFTVLIILASQLPELGEYASLQFRF